jgi:hypothetical protein
MKGGRKDEGGEISAEEIRDEDVDLWNVAHSLLL